MNPFTQRASFFFAVGFIFSSAFLIPVVSLAGPVEITKVNPYHFDGGPRVQTEDRMIEFENLRYYHGALTWEELRDRYGNYYSVYWKTNQPKVPATVRLEYRQANTSQIVHAREVVVSSPKRKNVTKFQITGEDYRVGGAVTQWRATIVQNGVVVAEYKSFLWK